MEWDEYPIVNDPESAGSATDDPRIHSGNPYVAYSDSKGITVRKWMYDGVWSWQPIGSDPISSVDTTDTTDTTDATDVSLHVCTGTSFLAFRDQIGAVSVKYAFGGGDEVVWNEVVDDSEDEKSISVSSASSLSFAAIPSYYSDGPPAFVAYKDLGGRVQLKAMFPFFKRWIRWLPLEEHRRLFPRARLILSLLTF